MKKIVISLAVSIFTVISSNAQTKHVLLEELTGTWCTYCPGGTYYLDSLTKENPNFIGVAVHVSDEMENTTYSTSSGLQGAPTANIDRGNQGIGLPYWFPGVASAFNSVPASDIGVTTDFNPSTRLLTVEVSATFFSAVSGNYRLAAIITEDGVTGPSPLYDQSNHIYSGGGSGPMGGFGYLPETVPAYMMVYNHVGRALLGGYNGQAGSVPSSVSVGSVVNYTFTYTLPTTWNEDNIKVIGMLIKPDNTLDNVGKSPYLDGNSNAEPIFISTPSTTAFVGSPYVFDVYATDPDDEDITITALNLPSWITMSAQSKVGFVHTKVALSGTPTAVGTYPVKLKVSDGTRSDTLEYSIIVGIATGTWELAGSQGFAESEKNLGIVTDKNGVLYALVTYNDFCNVYQKTIGGDWINYGNLGETGSFGHIRMGSDSLTPYVAYCTPPSLVHVRKYNNGSWTPFSTFPSNGIVQFGFGLDANDNPYIACQDIDNGSKGSCYTNNGASWNQIGNAAYSGSKVATFNDLVVNKSNGNVYVLWSDYNTGGVPKVSEWNGTSWSILGGGNISTNAVNFTQNIVIDKNTQQLYTAHDRGSNLDIYNYNGTSWVNIGSNISNGQVDNPKLTIDNDGTLFAAFIDYNYSSSVSAMKYSNGSWNYIGASGFSNSLSSECQITSYNNVPYVLYKDGLASNKSTVRFYNSNISGFEELNNTNASTLFVYPNPASDFIAINNLDNYSGQATLSIYNVYGALVKTEILNQNQQSINVGDLSNGQYFVTIKTNNLTQNQKLIIQK